jgi:hypothetical protein
MAEPGNTKAIKKWRNGGAISKAGFWDAMTRGKRRIKRYQSPCYGDLAIDCINHSTSLRANLAKPIKALSVGFGF